MNHSTTLPVLTIAIFACTDQKQTTEEPSTEEDSPIVVETYVPVRITVQDSQGTTIANAIVSQPGTLRTWTTNEEGIVDIVLDSTVHGEIAVSAASPHHKIRGKMWYRASSIPSEYTIVLDDIETDHHNYVYQNPGTPTDNDTTEKCSHCHITINQEWYGSVHQQSAQNSFVLDMFQGKTSTITTEEDCTTNGGLWQEGREAGNASLVWHCYLEHTGFLNTIEDCENQAACEERENLPGNCASCHAPTIPNTTASDLSTKNLLHSKGFAYTYGVQCDLCHKIYDVDMNIPNGGVGGKVILRRPDDDGSDPLNLQKEVMFGPLADVLNPRMGSVYRPIFHEARLCAGCHEHQHASVSADIVIDSTRWPNHLLPVYTTFTELSYGALGENVACQSCHMPPTAYALNAADLGNIQETDVPDVAFGWMRPAGEVHKHDWAGPRSNQSFLQSALALHIEKRMENNELIATIQTKNIGAGHAVPTGHPSRSVILLVSAYCDETELSAIGGDVVQDIGGYLEKKEEGEDWYTWENASVGDRIRVISRTGEWHDYIGTPPFDSTWIPAEKGLPVEDFVQETTITAINNGRIETSAPLATGTTAYLIQANTEQHAGHSGFSFAKILVDAEGNRNIPYYQAVDIVSDNRLLSHSSFASTHRFQSTCADPIIHASLYWRRFDYQEEKRFHWNVEDILIQEARK